MAAHKKQNLPEKLCVQCRRPFCWRKKWEKVWDEVKYCSDQCRRNSKRQRPEQSSAHAQPISPVPSRVSRAGSAILTAGCG
ncbi:DUF2256 domain-containing protein [Xanthomonas arboricola]|nr:DUF2256 domain-containing protein [Xanthomonas arboricola]CAD2264745.1 DUF2256 domain-containing protein [Xanthomonas arboricola]